MDYAKLAILLWIVFTILIAILAKKPLSKTFEITQNKFVRVDWRGYLFCAMIMGATASIGITFLVRSFS